MGDGVSVFDGTGALKRLRQLDEDLLSVYGTCDRFEVVIVGGSAIMLRNLAASKAYTMDIDVLSAAKEIESLLARYDMNMHVSTFLYQYPENWEKRKVRIPFEGDVLDVFTLSNEDLAITKMLSWRERDQGDVKGMVEAGNIDFKKLDAILLDITEVQANLDEETWEALLRRVDVAKGWCGA